VLAAGVFRKVQLSCMSFNFFWMWRELYQRVRRALFSATHNFFQDLPGAARRDSGFPRSVWFAWDTKDGCGCTSLQWRGAGGSLGETGGDWGRVVVAHEWLQETWRSKFLSFHLL
jgi:hypothetical protein